jgi:ribose 5-phosphate isomerase A
MSELVCQAALDWIVSNHKIENSTAENPFVIGIGSGTTIVPFVRLLAERMRRLSLQEPGSMRIVCIPTSEQARFLLLETIKSTKSISAILRLGTLDEFTEIDVTIDGADAVDFAGKFLIKGGGGAHCREKVICEASDSYVIVLADDSKLKKVREEYVVPVEILPFAFGSLEKKFQTEFADQLLDSKLRQCPSGSGKIGPVVTDNGNFIFDLKFSEEVYLNPSDLDRRIRQHAGVIETGIFWRLPNRNLLIYTEAGKIIQMNDFVSPANKRDL